MALVMLYAVAIAALVGLAAAGLEGAVRLYRRPGRWVWVVALGVSAGAPYLGPRLLGADPGSPGLGGQSEPGRPVRSAPGETTALGMATAAADRLAPALRALDRPARAVWLASSLAAVLVVLGAGISLARRRATWRRHRVDGRDVLISSDTGPALVGFPRGVIVLPRWALEVEVSLRDYMLRHEEEHRRAGDHCLLLLGVAALVAMPWNPVLWRQVKRLRLAIELDCDMRVLRARPAVREYGAMLLDVARRASRLPVMPAFSEGPSMLERRIRSMSAHPPTGGRPVRASALVALASLALAIACEVPAPTVPDRDEATAEPAVARFRSPDGTVAELANPREVEAMREAWYPPLLRQAGIGGTVRVWVVIGGDGRIVRRRIDRSSGEGPLDLAAIRVADSMRFRPIERPGDSASVAITFGRPPTPEEARARMRYRMRRAFADTDGRPRLGSDPGIR